MGLFDFLFKSKKKTPSYDVTNMKISDIREGFVIDYDLKSWIVKEEYEYDWGNNLFTYEYKLDSGDDTIYLTIEDDDDLSLYVMRKVKVRSIDQNLPEHIEKNQSPPSKLQYNGKTFLKDNERPGYYSNLTKKEDATEFVAWDYYCETDEDETITIEQWGEREFEASHGHKVAEHSFSSILPGDKE